MAARANNSISGLICLEMECHSISRQFNLRKTFRHPITGLVRFSDGHCKLKSTNCPPASEASREVANFNPKKISHTPVYCVKIS